jgi:hypothetical protein
VTFRSLFVVGSVVLVAACGGGSDTYTVDEVRAAFAEQGYELGDPPPDPSGSALNVWESEDVIVLTPQDGTPFFVFVGDAGAAQDLWLQYDSDVGPEWLDERRGNVVVFSDSDLDASQEARVRSALAMLPG